MGGMRGGWRKYWKVFLLGLEAQMEYRANYFFETVIGLITFGILYFLWHSVYGGSPDRVIAGLNFREMLTYVLLAKFWDWVIDPAVEIDQMLPEDIRHGGLNRILTRPLNDRLYRFSIYLSHKLLHSVMRIGPVVVVILCLPNLFTFQPSVDWMYLPLAAIMALILQFSFSYLVAMIAFWWLEIWGILFLKRLAVSFLAGAWMPLTLFPEPVAAVFQWLPFHYMVFFPIQLVLGKIPPEAVRTGLLTQAGWILIFTLLGQLVWSRGMRQYSAAGI